MPANGSSDREMNKAECWGRAIKEEGKSPKGGGGGGARTNPGASGTRGQCCVCLLHKIESPSRARSSSDRYAPGAGELQ